MTDQVKVSKLENGVWVEQVNEMTYDYDIMPTIPEAEIKMVAKSEKEAIEALARIEMRMTSAELIQAYNWNGETPSKAILAEAARKEAHV